MKILFVQPTSDKRGHNGLWTTRFCQALGEAGHDVCLYTNKVYPERYLQSPPSFTIIQVAGGKYAFHRFDEIAREHPWFFWYGYFRNTYHVVRSALTFCRNMPFDAVYLTDAEYMIASLLLRRHRGVIPPVFWHVQAANFTFGTYHGSLAKRVYKTVQRRVFRRVIGHEVRGLVVLGDFHRKQLRAQLALAQSFPVEIVPDGGAIPGCLPEQAVARQQIGVDYEGPIFLFLGMLRQDKGIEYLVEAVSHLRQEEFRVIIAGACRYLSASDIEKMCRRFAVSDKIILRLHYIDDEQMPLYYSASDVVVFPYRKSYTGSCGPLTKGACSHQRPVIVTDVADMGRLVREHQVGFVAEAENSDALAAKMLEFLRLPGEQKQTFRENAGALVASCSWETVAQELISYIGKALDHGLDSGPGLVERRSQAGSAI